MTTTTFTASSGVEIRILDDGSIFLDYDTVRLDSALGAGVTLSARGEDALREFFQHERDEQLGQWRDPIRPDFVVRRVPEKDDDDGRCVSVVSERLRLDYRFWEHEMQRYLGGPDSEVRRHASCAARYFAAHPESKLWHDAKPGEVWAVSLPQEERACAVAERLHEPNTFVDPAGRLPGLPVTDPDITSARRIWPETQEKTVD